MAGVEQKVKSSSLMLEPACPQFEFQQFKFVQVSWHAIVMITPVLCQSSTALFVVFTMCFGNTINI